MITVPFHGRLPSETTAITDPALSIGNVPPSSDNPGEALMPPPPSEEGSRRGLRDRLHTAILGAEIAVAGTLISPVNEIARLAIYSAVMATEHGSPVAGAIALGGATAVIESTAGFATADALASPVGEKFVHTLNEKAAKVGFPPEKKLPAAVKTFGAFMGGTPVGMLLEQRDNPDRTVAQNRRYSVVTPAWQGGVLAGVGALAAEGIDVGIDNPIKSLILGLTVATATGIGVAAKKAWHKFRGEKAVPIEEQFKGYEALIADYNTDSPQHQGLNQLEYTAALQNPNVVSTDVEVDGKRVAMPQLSPVESYGWLNADFYKDKFPEETEAGNVMHFTSLPDVAPSKQVRERLLELAGSDGVIVFDNPSSDPEYEYRIRALFEEAGIEAGETQLLGTQTYYAGQLKLENYDPNAPHTDFYETFKQAIADGDYDTSRIQNGASIHALIPDSEETQRMREFYDAAYADISDHPCNQGLTPDQFADMMTKEPEVAKVVNTRQGNTTALMLLSSNLRELDWVNESYYERNFPDKAATDQIVWFPGLAADPSSSQRHNLQEMVGVVAEMCAKGNNEVMVVFDCCDKNAGRLDGILNFYINRAPQTSINIQPIAQQSYFAVRISRKQ